SRRWCAAAFSAKRAARASTTIPSKSIRCGGRLRAPAVFSARLTGAGKFGKLEWDETKIAARGAALAKSGKRGQKNG
ncbi:MAG: hypothetical protein IKN53_04715, partial [Oscillibacter sp.]|nr:hypothetical protein [Oscillibacter sp.]